MKELSDKALKSVHLDKEDVLVCSKWRRLKKGDQTD